MSIVSRFRFSFAACFSCNGLPGSSIRLRPDRWWLLSWPMSSVLARVLSTVRLPSRFLRSYPSTAPTSSFPGLLILSLRLGSAYDTAAFALLVPRPMLPLRTSSTLFMMTASCLTRAACGPDACDEGGEKRSSGRNGVFGGSSGSDVTSGSLSSSSDGGAGSARASTGLLLLGALLSPFTFRRSLVVEAGLRMRFRGRSMGLPAFLASTTRLLGELVLIGASAFLSFCGELG